MANFSEAFKNEVARLAKKEARQIETEWKDTLSAIRKTLQEHKQKISKIETLLEKIYSKDNVKSSSLEEPADASEKIKGFRFTPASILKIRESKGLSRNKMAKLLGINPNSIFLWETGKTVPRDQMKSSLIKLKATSKRELSNQLEGNDDSSDEVIVHARKRKARRRLNSDVKPRRKPGAAAKAAAAAAPAADKS